MRANIVITRAQTENCANARHCMLSQAAQVRFGCERVAMLNALAQSRSAPGERERTRKRKGAKARAKDMAEDRQA